jgi:hypothetical protein
MLNDFVYVPISLNLYREVLDRYPDSPHSLIHDVIYNFLERNSDEWNEQFRDGGYRWEKLLLPEGTKIRTKYFGEYLEATVAEKKIVWKKTTYDSIAKVINVMRGGTKNNAWKVSQIKRPSDKDWVAALKLRV